MNRRNFTKTALLAGAAPVALQAQNENSKYRVVVIGHTGRGNFGHGLDTVWFRHPETAIVAVADADAAGLAKAGEKLKIGEKGRFLDYKKMLAEVKPDLVAVCPRHADQHADMTLAAIESGARGIYVEKPFARTPKEADEILAAAEKANTKIAVAHRNRYHPALQVIDGMIEKGELGNVLEIRGRGKGDRRGGAEDLWVLGSHVLNLMAYFGGPVRTCSGVLMKDGKRVVTADVYEGAEGLGPMAGNEAHARYLFESGLTGYFDSIADDGTENAGFGLQIIGSKGIVNIQCDRNPIAHFVPGNPFAPTDQPRPWIPITTGGVGEEESDPAAAAAVGNHDAAIKDLISAIESDRAPLCGAEEGALTVEMIHAVYESHRQDSAAVSLPLEQRENALSILE